MFMKQEQPFLNFDLESLVGPYLFLDKTLFKDNSDGLACRKKFSNDGLGVPTTVRLKLENQARAILKDEFKPENWLAYVDTFWIFANHIDQQRLGECLPIKEKEALVLTLLEAAYKISPKYDYAHLDAYSPRELSTHQSLIHFLGKARRYVSVAPQDRLELLTEALRIARYLTDKKLSEQDDPHAYMDRIPTAEMPVLYCLQDLERFKEALEISLAQTRTVQSSFQKTQAHVQTANIYLKQYKKEGGSLDNALTHAREAMKFGTLVSQMEGNHLPLFNARESLMNVLQASEKYSAATSMADAILEEMDNNPDCGAKPAHRYAAEKILLANQVGYPCFMA